MIKKAEPAVVRCAIYTRVSVAAGLDRDLNSLDLQRQACESYVKARADLGWEIIDEEFADGGYTGANLDRPAFQRLLGQIDAGKIDVVLVYKADRLSRSLLDFAKVMDRFNQAGTAFVSVTQNFSTADAMGRLTLNMLMSFAAFEREIIAERTKDKMCAARRKGKFVGSTPPLGYRIAAEGGRLVIDPVEAERVRAIFDLYLRRGTLIRTVAELNRRGWTTKRWVSKKGTVVGGTPFVSTNLYALLTNATLAGLVRFHGELYPGEHDAVVAPDLWKRVQERLRSNRNGDGRSTRASRGTALLRGILVCAPCGKPMVHVCTSARGSRRYQYYRCEGAIKRGAATCPSGSLPAAEIERYVVDELAAIGRDEAVIAETARQAREIAEAEVHRLEAERAESERTLRDLGENLREAVAGPVGGLDPTRLTALQERIATAQARMVQIGKELEAAEAGYIGEHDLRQALADFSGVWNTMTPDQRQRALAALVERVAYDGPKGEIAITFRPVGTRGLAGEAQA